MTNYTKGRRKEYQLIHRLELEGYIIIRSAGSHGFADIVAIKFPEIRFIQVKPDDFSEAEAMKLLGHYHKFNEEDKYWNTSFEVI